MEGVGNLKGFIKARNRHTLKITIQAAREEEKIKTSSEESKKHIIKQRNGEQSLITHIKNQSGSAMYAETVCKTKYLRRFTVVINF